MRELDKSKMYSLSELNSKELKEIWVLLKTTDVDWSDCEFGEVINESDKSVLCFNSFNWEWDNSIKLEEATNAKELFYTLENIQVDCRGLSEEYIKQMAYVFEANGYKIWNNTSALNVSDINYLLEFTGREVFTSIGSEGKTTITYEKFMELFSRKEENFKKLVEVLNEELTEEAYKETEYEVKYIAEKPKHYAKGIDTFARMEANCTTEECLAFAKGNIDKYNFRTKGQDLEDYKKIVSYANWAISLLNKA